MIAPLKQIEKNAARYSGLLVVLDLSLQTKLSTLNSIMKVLWVDTKRGVRPHYYNLITHIHSINKGLVLTEITVDVVFITVCLSD